MDERGAYNADLAYVHDAGFGDFTRDAAPALLDILAECGNPSKLVVDLGCGSGIWAGLLVASGYEVLGVDVSQDMLEIARRRVPGGTFVTGSFVDFPLPPCRAVTALGEVFNYLFDANHSRDAFERVCRNVFASLVSGGVFIFDIAEPGRSRGLKQAFREGDDWTCLVEYTHDEPHQLLTRRIVTFRKFGETFRRHEETHRQQLYPRGEVQELLRRIGFQVEIVTGYGTRPFPEAMAGFIARKPQGGGA